jgi:hypothetical protein
MLHLAVHGQACVEQSDGYCVIIESVRGKVWFVACYLSMLAWQWSSNQSAINTPIARLHFS